MLGATIPAGGLAGATAGGAPPAAPVADGARLTADDAAMCNWRYFCMSTAAPSDAYRTLPADGDSVSADIAK